MDCTFTGYLSSVQVWLLFFAFDAFRLGMYFAGIGLLWFYAMLAARRALLATLEIATIVEAAREAKRQGRMPILRTWQSIQQRWKR